MLGKKITDYFCFLPPHFLSTTLKIVILFLFSAASSSPQPWKLSEDTFMLWIKSILILSLNFMCELPMFHLSSLFSAFFFSLTWFPFCLLSWTASHSMPPQVQNHGLFLPILLSTDHSQARQQLLSQNMQKCMASNGVQSSAGLQAALPPISGVTQTIPNTVVRNPNMQSIPGVSQNSMGNSMGQGIPSTMFASSQRQMPGNALFGSFMCHCCHLWH